MAPAHNRTFKYGRASSLTDELLTAILEELTELKQEIADLQRAPAPTEEEGDIQLKEPARANTSTRKSARQDRARVGDTQPDDEAGSGSTANASTKRRG